MKRFLISLALGSVVLSAHAQKFGGGADMSKLIEATELLSKVDAYKGQSVTLKGVVTKVCKKRGCWMNLKVTKSNEITVKVKDGVMEFPMSAIGRTSYATGTIHINNMDLEKTRKYLAHKAEENGEPFDASAITVPMSVKILKPTAVTIAK